MSVKYSNQIYSQHASKSGLIPKKNIVVIKSEENRYANISQTENMKHSALQSEYDNVHNQVSTIEISKQ